VRDGGCAGSTDERDLKGCVRAWIAANASAWASGPPTKIAQGWAKLWANFRALIGIFSQSVGPSLAIWANPGNFRCPAVLLAPPLRASVSQTEAVGSAAG
jgi:hypothetical protein